MTKIKHVVILAASWMCSVAVQAQEKWDLRKCVEYAVANNISVRQADIDARTAKLTFQASKWSQLGQVSGSTSLALTFGRSIDPTTNLYTTSQLLYQDISVSASANLFNWFSLKRTIEANQFAYVAQQVYVEKVKNDVSLNVAAAYLQALESRQQINVNMTQVELTLAQLNNTRKLVEAGSVPELNAAELESQLASDSATLIGAQSTYEQNVLQLKGTLNMDAAYPFILDTPSVESIPLEPIAELQPDVVYGLAEKTFPQQQLNEYRIKAAEKTMQSLRGQLYPTLSIFGGLGNSFAGNLKRDGFSHVFDGYWNQLDVDFRQNVGLQLSIPIFNGNLSRTNYQKAKLNIQSANLTKQSDLLALKQDIYQAYTTAIAALQKYQANLKGLSTAQRSYDLAKKRYDIGLLNTIDYITNQNNLFKAKINLLASQYDFVFKTKVLEFYKGRGMKM